MFIFNNIHDRNYRKVFPNYKNVIFDLSKKQINNVNNSDWKDIREGDLACVVTSTRKISTIYKVLDVVHYGEVEGEEGDLYVLRGAVVAKLRSPQDMSTLLNKLQVEHSKLPDNKFSIGFNVANCKHQLNLLEVETETTISTIGDLKKNCITK